MQSVLSVVNAVDAVSVGGGQCRRCSQCCRWSMPSMQSVLSVVNAVDAVSGQHLSVVSLFVSEWTSLSCNWCWWRASRILHMGPRGNSKGHTWCSQNNNNNNNNNFQIKRNKLYSMAYIFSGLDNNTILIQIYLLLFVSNLWHYLYGYYCDCTAEYCCHVKKKLELLTRYTCNSL